MSGTLTATASPVSGSTFPIGTTTVNVTATDAAGNTGSASFTVTIDGDAVLPKAVDDAVTATTGKTLVYPLANDLDPTDAGLTLVATSEPTVVIKDRALEIPAGYTGTFSYTVSNGIGTAAANVAVIAGAPIATPTKWQGLLYDATGAIAGRVTASRAGGRVVAGVQVGASSSAAIFKLAGASGVAFPLGTINSALDGDGHLAVSVINGGETYTADLRPGRTTFAVLKHNIALASVSHAGIPGGGYMRVTTTRDAHVTYIAKLPDGRITFGGGQMRDNGSFVIYRRVFGTSPNAVIGGEFTLANLAATGLTGELEWNLPAQSSGLHVTGLTTTLTGNGCVFTPSAALAAGAMNLRVSGGDLATPINTTTVAVAGKPTSKPTIAVWVAYPLSGTCFVTIKHPAFPAGARGSGIYIQKTNSAWGYFKGTTVGGRLDLTPVP